MLARNSDIVRTAPYDSISTATGNFGTGGTVSSEAIQTLHQYRIRQSGTITKIRLYIASKTNVTAFYLKIWRKIGGNSYYLIGTSENFVASTTAGQINSITLSSPISGVREGDFYALRIESSSSSAAIVTNKSGLPGGGYNYVLGATPSPTNYAWESQTDAIGHGIPIEIYMQAPHMVFIGDSITSGTDHRAYLDASVTVSRPGQSIPWCFNQLAGHDVVYQNMGIWGQTSTQIAARIAADCVNLAPRYANVQMGINDIIGGVITEATYIANWTAVLNALVGASTPIIPLINLIPPRTLGSTEYCQKRDAWNAALIALAASYPTAKVIGFDPYMGQFRVGGDAGNLWDLQAACDIGDGSHPSLYGNYQYAKAIADKILQPASRRRPISG